MEGPGWVLSGGGLGGQCAAGRLQRAMGNRPRAFSPVDPTS